MGTLGNRESSTTVASVLALLALLVALVLAACGGSNSSATPLPTPTVAGTLAFGSVVTAQGNADIYVVSADGTGKTQLTDDPGWEEHPSWSPDGSRIAYVVYPEGSLYGHDATLWIMNADGSGKVQLSKGAARGYHPAWSSDGTQIAYTGRTQKQAYAEAVFVMNADGSDPRRVTPTVDYGFPTWASDGRILFRQDGDVVALDLATNRTQQLTTTGNLDEVGNVEDFTRIGDFALSPDGQWIAIHDGSYDRIALIAAQGGGAPPKTLLDGVSKLFTFSASEHNVAPVWTPDGTALALASSDAYGMMSDSRLYIVNADGSGLSAVPGVDNAVAPAWRPE